MITVSSAMKQKEITEVLESFEGDCSFLFEKKQGIRLIFKVTGDDKEAAKLAKELIKSQPWGSILYFQVVVS